MAKNGAQTEKRNVGSQTEVSVLPTSLVDNITPVIDNTTPVIITELQDMETQTAIVSESETIQNTDETIQNTGISSSMTSSDYNDSSDSRRKRTLPWDQYPRPWKIKNLGYTNFSLDAVKICRFHMNSIHRNPTKFTKITGPALGRPAVETAYVKVCCIHYAYIMQHIVIIHLK